MPTFQAPVVTDVPPVLAPGDPEMAPGAYALFRHYSNRPRGLNVYIYRAGSTSATRFGRVSEADPVATYVNGVAVSDGWEDIELVAYGGHAPVTVTDDQAAALVEAGYTVS